ncbi:protein bric-a-brac 1-like [Portunus trituberculatus]|uniref:protein bric-a-brac 1-like n=1 Tax=Portunus trituberculatus TaxID=210409 RepID=UPI001E1CCAC5|nr:protein bric-a-brac 1-like [Portunus trituberculatus]
MLSEKTSPLSPLLLTRAPCHRTMSNEGNSPDREDSPHSSPTDLMTLARQHFRNRWTTPPSRDSEGDEEYQLRWEGHGSQLTNMVTSLEDNQASSDVTVVTKGASIPSHRLVLAAASPFFCQILQDLPTTQHPVIVIKTADPRHLRYLVSFCYTGTVTLHSHDLQQVLQLAEDLEIRGLKITLAEGRSSPSLATLAALHPRLFHPSSPNTRFPFSQPLHRPSSVTPTSLGYSDVSAKFKRNMSPSDYKEGQSKRIKVEPLAVDGDKRPHSNPSSYYIPPASAPPILPSYFLFKGTPGSPPNSAPPQSFGESFPLQGSSPAADDNKDRDSPGVSLVPSSRLLQPSSRSSSRPPSPQQDTISRSQSPTVNVSQIPTPVNRKVRESSTPSTPTTPSTPSARPATEPGSSGVLGGSSGSRVLLWRFLLDLLHNPLYAPMYIRWLDRAGGVFRIMESDMVAQLWGRARKNQNMNYEKMSRGMRTYYKRGILFHIDGTKLIYRFNTKDPEIEQRMQYYDMMKANSEGDVSSEQNTLSSILPPSTLAPPSTPPITSSPATALENIYSNPLFRDMAQLPHSLLYEPYMSLFRNASRSELY